MKRQVNLKTDDLIRFLFLGDLMLGGEFISYADKHDLDYLYPFDLLKPELSGVDIVFVNLEGPLFEGSNYRPDVTLLLSNHHAIVDLFDDCGISVINLGNNHIMDYGIEGLKKTLSVIKKKGLCILGAGDSIKEANTGMTVKIRDTTVGFLSFTSDEPNVNAIIASAKKPGCDSFQDYRATSQKVEKLKKEVDIVCVSLHWGHEFYLYPSYEQIKLAHRLVDAGADYIIGHHPHVIQGIERYKGSLIIYSLGNFFMPPFRFLSGRMKIQDVMEREFVIVKSEFNHHKRSIIFDILGGLLSKNYKLILYDSLQHNRFQEKIEILSRPFRLSDYERFWIEYKLRIEKELQRRDFMFALKKLATLKSRDLKTISFEDIKRNLSRFKKNYFHL